MPAFFSMRRHEEHEENAISSLRSLYFSAVTFHFLTAELEEDAEWGTLSLRGVKRRGNLYINFQPPACVR